MYEIFLAILSGIEKSSKYRVFWQNCKAIHLVSWKEVCMTFSWQFYLELRSRQNTGFFGKIVRLYTWYLGKKYL